MFTTIGVMKYGVCNDIGNYWPYKMSQIKVILTVIIISLKFYKYTVVNLYYVSTFMLPVLQKF